MTVICFIAIVILMIWVANLQSDIENLRKSMIDLIKRLELDGYIIKKQTVNVSKEKISPLVTDVMAKVNYDAINEKQQITKKVSSKTQTTEQKKVCQKSKKLGAWQNDSVSSNVKNKETKNGTSHLSFGGGKSPIVWIAGIAAILGAFYLVKYLVMHGILGPAVRLTLLAIAGFVSVFCGAMLYNKKNFADNERIAQVLMGVGVTALYFVSYALSKLYFFAPEWVSFILMCVVSIGTISLTLKFGGQPIAVLSMLGGFLTPLLVSDISMHLAFFSGYMLIFVAAFLYIAVVLRSSLLFVLALLGGYIWAFLRLFFFDFYLFDSVFFMLLVGGISVMTIKASRHFVNEQVKELNVISLILCGFMVVSCLIKAHFGILEWSICGLVLGFISILSLYDEKKYLPIAVVTTLLMLMLMLYSMNGTMTDLIVLVGIGLAAMAPIYFGLLARFPHATFSLYIGAMQIAFFGVGYMIFGKGFSLTLYGLIGGGLCLLPVLAQKLKTVKEKKCGGILVLSAMAMITFGLTMLFDRADELVIIAVSEILILSAASRLHISYVKEGVSCLILWYGLMMYKAIFYMVLLLLPVGGDIVEFQLSDLSLSCFVCYWIVPLICFTGSFFVFKDKEIRQIMLWLVNIVAFAGLFMLLMVIKMEAFDLLTYKINIYDYAVITNILLALVFVFRYKFAHASLGLFGWTALRLCVTFCIIFGSVYHSAMLSYGGVLFVLGVPLVLLVMLTYYRGACFLALAYSFAVVTAFVNISLFGYPHFGETYLLGDGALFIYSVVWFVLGVVWMMLAFYYKELIKPAFGIIYFVIAKVFLYDVANLSDFWRIIALFALAGSLLAVSHFYTKNFKDDMV